MMRAFACIACVLLASTQVLAAGKDLGGLFDAACAHYEVPKPLALAIADQESSMRPWALNVEGRTVPCTTKAQALAMGRQALAAGLSFDVGVMQINSWWIRRLNLPLEVLLEPEGNIRAGAWILSQEIKRHGLNWQAVASYHTPLTRNPERGRAYAARVLTRLQDSALAEALAVPGAAFVASSRPSQGQTVVSAPASILVKRFRVVAENTERIIR